MSLSDGQLVELYRWMVMDRLLDERTDALFRMGRVMSMFHPVLGHEAAIVGSVYALQTGDALLPHYRGKALYMMRGIALDYFVAGLLGKREGLGQGRAVDRDEGSGPASLLPVNQPMGVSSGTDSSTTRTRALARSTCAVPSTRCTCSSAEVLAATAK